VFYYSDYVVDDVVFCFCLCGCGVWCVVVNFVKG